MTVEEMPADWQLFKPAEADLPPEHVREGTARVSQAEDRELLLNA